MTVAGQSETIGANRGVDGVLTSQNYHHCSAFSTLGRLVQIYTVSLIARNQRLNYISTDDGVLLVAIWFLKYGVLVQDDQIWRFSSYFNPLLLLVTHLIKHAVACAAQTCRIFLPFLSYINPKMYFLLTEENQISF